MAFSWTDLAAILAQLSQGRAEGQIAQGNIDARNDQNATSRFQAMVNANRLQNIEQPSANASQVQRGTVMNTFQPVSISHPRANIPTISGGPQMTPEMRNMGSELVNSALKRQMGGNQIDTSMFPEDMGTGGSGGGSFLDTLLAGATPAAGILGLLKNAGIGGGGASAGATAANNPWTAGATPWGEPTPPPGSAPSPSFGGGSGSPGGPTGMQDLASRSQLNEFGIGPNDYMNDQSGGNLEQTIPDPLERARQRRLSRGAWR